MPKKGSKKQKEESDPEPEAAATPEESEDEAPPPKKAAPKHAFAAMMDDSESEPEVDSEVAAFGKKKKQKEKKVKEEKEEKKDKKEKKEKKEKKAATPTIGEVTSTAPVPKNDKLRVCKVMIGEDKPVDIITNAENVVAGKKYVVALPGVTTASGIEVKPRKVGGVESYGIFCGPEELGWACDVLHPLRAVEPAASAAVGSPCPSYEEALEAHRGREKAAAAEKAKEEAKNKKGKKGAKQDDEDIDALLEEFGTTPAPEAAGGKNKKKKGKAGAKAAEDDDLDAALAEIKEPEPKAEKAEEPAPAPAAAAPEPEVDAKTLANRKKKDKKKGNKAGADDDDFDAALEESKDDSAPAASSSAAAPAPEAAPAAEKEEEVDAKTLANRKKKEKKKNAKAVGGEGMWGDAAEPAPAADDDAAASSATAPEPAPAPAPKKGGKPEKKESAAVKAARERMEAQKKLDEERRAFEEEQRRLIEEENRKIAEEEARIEAEREKKREARRLKIERQKAEGTYMSKAEKARVQRAAQLREQFGFDIDDKGDEEEEEGDGEAPAAAPAPKKKSMASMYTSKKKQQKKPKEEEEEAAAKEEPAKEEALKPEAKPNKPAKAAEPEEDDDDENDWEKVGEELDKEKEAAAAKAAAKEAAAKEKEAKKKKKKDDDSDEDSEEESGSDDGSDSDSDSDNDSSSSDFPGYRSPIICIMGHVDTGKTKLLDKIRRTNVQEGEAGGITQQIGATFFPDIALMEQTKKVDKSFDIEVPGIMVIDTPGHESFNNLRARGSSLCDMAILVIDIMHGLEPQTVESLEMLKKRRCPFVIAMNKIDRCHDWDSRTYCGVVESLERQKQHTRDEFEKRYQGILLQLNERGLNCKLYYENDDYRQNICIIPTSAHTGEGVPDLLYMLIKLSQTLMPSKLEVQEELQCTVIEVKNIEGLGTTIDVVLVNGTIRNGDQIVLAGMGGPIVTTIRALLTPQPMKEMRVKNDYVHHDMINQSMGIKICAPGLEEAVAGTELLICGPDDDLEELKEEVDEGFDSILNEFQKETEGVYVKASTLGSLEALLSFLQDMKIPVFDVGIGEVHKKDVKKALIMKEKKHPEYAVILAFDVKVNNEAKLAADKEDVKIMTADIIYHLFDQFTKYMEEKKAEKKTESRQEVVFPVILKIDKNCLFHKRDPIVLGCDIVAGQLRVGTPLCVPEVKNLDIGRVGSIERDHKPIQVARRGDRVCVKIEQTTAQNHIALGRHFEAQHQLYSHITRQSIDTLKENFRDEMKKEDWELIMAMKKVFEI